MTPTCPKDGAALRVMERDGVTIDVCPECKGVWLDRGELDKLIQAAHNTDDELAREYASPRRDLRPKTRYGDDDDDHDDRDWRNKRKDKSPLKKLFDIFD